MDADAIMQTCLAAGLRVRMGDAGTLLVTPVACITTELRALIRDHKNVLLQALRVPTTRDTFDDRIACTECRNLARGSRCQTHRRARLTTCDLAADFVALKQRCDGFAPLAQNTFERPK